MPMVRQLTAIMFTDMVGYTALMQQDERQAKAQRDRQRGVLETSIDAFGGRILQFYGDGTLSVFPSAVEAVRSAMAIQAELSQEPQVPLRIGLHTGDVVHDEDGVFGDGVNVAARIQGLASPGSVLVSDKLFDDIKNHTDIRATALGEFALKNVARPTTVHAIVNDGLAVPDPADLKTVRSRDLRTVAVLPFVNMSADPENEFFADGMTEEIINALTRVSGVQVTARTSSFAFKGRNEDVREIAAQLGVATVLEGSVRRAGNRVRIAAQLINADDGYHLFSEVFDRPIDDIFATQDELSATIVARLEGLFDPGTPPGTPTATPTVQPVSGHGHSHAHPSRPHSHDTEAYTEYLKGRFYGNKWTPNDAHMAIRHLERSAEMDPTCALPFSSLATIFTYLASIGQLPAEDAYPRAAAYAREALALAEGGGEGHIALGVVKLFYEWDFEGASAALQKALELTPGSADAHHMYGMFLKATGQHRASVSHLKKAVRIDPLSLPLNQALAISLFAADRVEDAEAQITRTLELDPTFRASIETAGWIRMRKGDPAGALAHFEALPLLSNNRFAGAAHRGLALARLGRMDEANDMLKLLMERRVEEPRVNLRMDMAVMYYALQNVDETFNQLNHAVDERLGGIVFLNTSPNWKPLRKDPRFKAIVERVGVPLLEEEDE